MYNEYKEDSIMTEDTRKFVEEKTKEILNAGSCCPELKEMAQYCICPACSAGGAILDKKNEIL